MLQQNAAVGQQGRFPDFSYLAHSLKARQKLFTARGKFNPSSELGMWDSSIICRNGMAGRNPYLDLGYSLRGPGEESIFGPVLEAIQPLWTGWEERAEEKEKKAGFT